MLLWTFIRLYVDICFQFILRNCQTLLQGGWLHHFAFPSAVDEDNFFTFSPVLVISCFFFFIIAILVGIKWRWKSLSRVRLFATPWTLQSMAFSRPEYWSGYLIQGIFPTQGSNPGLRHYRWILYQLTHKRSPRILEWVAYPFSSGSSRPRNWTGVSCIAGGFFTNWAIREAVRKES